MYCSPIPLPSPPLLTYISVLFVLEVAPETEKNESEKVKRAPTTPPSAAPKTWKPTETMPISQQKTTLFNKQIIMNILEHFKQETFFYLAVNELKYKAKKSLYAIKRSKTTELQILTRLKILK